MTSRSALCIGINQYPGTGADLHGCVNDALDWSELALSRGYVVSSFFDEAATKANILAHLESMLFNAGWGDRILFTFSGHGTWIPDADGDEADARDEALVPHDFSSAGVITDDELYQLFAARPRGVRVTVMSDSCHSGTVARGLFDSRSPALPRFLAPEYFLSGSQLAAAKRVQSAPARGTPRPGVILFSGCADLEYSYDAVIDGRPCGAFSHAALSVTRNYPSLNVRDLYAGIRARLPSEAYPQTPQLVASLYQRRTKALW